MPALGAIHPANIWAKASAELGLSYELAHSRLRLQAQQSQWCHIVTVLKYLIDVQKYYSTSSLTKHEAHPTSWWLIPVHLIIMLPCPLMEHLGFIKQRRLGHSTATPWAMSDWLGVDGFGHLTARWPRVVACIFWENLACGGGGNLWPNCNGQAKLDWSAQSKKSSKPKSTIGLLAWG